MGPTRAGHCCVSRTPSPMPNFPSSNSDLRTADFDRWSRLQNEADAPSPSLLIFPDRVEANLQHMLAIIGDPARLRPHIKTHKLPQIVARQVALGITKCKAATIAEAEMAAQAGASDVLLAVQLVGPNVSRFATLQRAFPSVTFTTLADDAGVLAQLSASAVTAAQTFEVLLDLDVGQHRTGVAPGIVRGPRDDSGTVTPGSPCSAGGRYCRQ